MNTNLLTDTELADVLSYGILYYKRAYAELINSIGEIGAATGAAWAANWAIQMRIIVVAALRQMPVVDGKGTVQ